MRFLWTDYLSVRHNFWPRPLSVGTHPTVTTCKSNTGMTLRFLRFHRTRRQVRRWSVGHDARPVKKAPARKKAPPKRGRCTGYSRNRGNRGSAAGQFGTRKIVPPCGTQRRVLDGIAIRVGRAGGQGTLVLWGLRPEFRD